MKGLLHRGKLQTQVMLDPSRRKNGHLFPYRWRFSPEYPRFPEGRITEWNKEKVQACTAALDAGHVAVVLFAQQSHLVTTTRMQPELPPNNTVVGDRNVPRGTSASPLRQPQTTPVPAIIQSTPLHRTNVQRFAEEHPDLRGRPTITEAFSEPLEEIQDEVKKMCQDRLISTLKDELRNAKTNAGNQFSEISALKVELIALNNRFEAAEAQVQVVWRENSETQAQLHQAHEKARADISKLEANRLASKEKVQRANSQMAIQSSDITRLQAQISSLRQETTDAARQLPTRLLQAKRDGEYAERQRMLADMSANSKSEQRAHDLLVRSHFEELWKARTEAYDKGLKAGRAGDRAGGSCGDSRYEIQTLPEAEHGGSQRLSRGSLEATSADGNFWESSATGRFQTPRTLDSLLYSNLVDSSKLDSLDAEVCDLHNLYFTGS
jgi:hypothetical protein